MCPLFVLLLSPGLTTFAAAAAATESPLYLCTQLCATHAGDAFTVMRPFGLAWAAPWGSPIDSGCPPDSFLYVECMFVHVCCRRLSSCHGTCLIA